MRIAAGTGIAGLAGIRQQTRLGALRLVRPLLGVSKERLIATCRARGWPMVVDPSNTNPRFARVRMRALLPLLSAEGLTAGRLAALARRAADADAALAAVAQERLGAALLDDHRLDARHLLAGPSEIARRALGLLLLPEADVFMPPLPLQRLEALHAALTQAMANGTTVRRTLSGQLISLDSLGILTIHAEPPRKRGRATAQTVKGLTGR